MKTRTRTAPTEEKNPFLFDEEDHFDLEHLSDEELEEFLFEEEDPKGTSPFNLPTMAGLSIIMVGIAYIFQELGWLQGFDVTSLAVALPWLAGILIILLGFGVLSWRPKKKKKRVKVKVQKAAMEHKDEAEVIFETVREKAKAAASATSKTGKRKLAKTRDKKISGVAGGLAEYFNIDPTLVRIAFVIATIATGGNFIFAYLLLTFVMPKPPPLTMEERITIIRDS